MDIHVCDICGDRNKRARSVFAREISLPALDAHLKRQDVKPETVKVSFNRGTVVHLCDEHALEVLAEIINGQSAKPIEEETFE